MTLPVDSTNPVVRFKENRDITWSSGPTFSLVTRKHVNNYGFLNDQDYSPTAKSPLLAIIGDSYVEAAQVENEDTLHGLLARAAAGKGRVYSFGSSGSPLSTYLAYAQYATKEFGAQALVIVVVGNDFDESLLKYKSAPGFHYFSDVSGRLVLVRRDYEPTLIKRLARHSALVRYFVLNVQLRWQHIERFWKEDDATELKEFVGNTRAAAEMERISESQRAVDTFLDELPRLTGLASDRVLFVVDGMRPHLYDSRALESAERSYFAVMRRYFMKEAASKGYEVIDMQDCFIQVHTAKGIRFEFPTDLHWNEAGHGLVAEKIEHSLVYRGLFGSLENGRIAETC